jgi:hypothetical protein
MCYSISGIRENSFEYNSFFPNVPLVEISIPIKYFLDSPDLTIICRLLNTKSLLLIFLRNLNHDRQCNIKKKNQSNITQMFYWERIKIKTPLSYIMYIMDHETISYKTLI